MSDEKFEKAQQSVFPTAMMPGLSLRDYFAARAMQAGIGRWGGAGSMYDEGACTHSRLAQESYQIADAMLAAREVQS